MNIKFSTLVNLYENDVYTLALYLLRNKSDAEDAAQETYLKLWENLEKVEFLRAKSWLLRVARNTCLDRLRKRRFEYGSPSSDMQVESSQCPEDSLMQEQQHDRLAGAIENLDEPYRSLIVLRDIHQNSYREIEIILDLTPDQVKVYLHRARKKLKAELIEVDV